MKTKNIIYKITKEIATNHARIIDDFAKLYLAVRWRDYFSKHDLNRLELVERQEGLTTIYSFRIKRGRSKTGK